MNYPKSYKYAARKKSLTAFKEKVVCVIASRHTLNLSFEKIAKECKISDRSEAYRLYSMNRLDPEFKHL